MQSFDSHYKTIATDILTKGIPQVIQMQQGPTNIVALFNASYTFPGHLVPLLSLRKVHLKTLIRELRWILSGSHNVCDLGSSRHIWEPWADEDGNLPSSYGRMLRAFPGYAKNAAYSGEAVDSHLHVDQVAQLINSLKSDYPSRRLQLTLNHPANFFASGLPPCMSGLSLNWFHSKQTPGFRHVVANIKFRSSDFGVGFVFDILQWYLFVQLLLQTVNQSQPEGEQYRLSAYSFTSDNLHIYEEHYQPLEEVLKRSSKPPTHWAPDLVNFDASNQHTFGLHPETRWLGLHPTSTIDGFELIQGIYDPHPHIHLPLIV